MIKNIHIFSLKLQSVMSVDNPIKHSKWKKSIVNLIATFSGQGKMAFNWNKLVEARHYLKSISMHFYNIAP